MINLKVQDIISILNRAVLNYPNVELVVAQYFSLRLICLCRKKYGELR